MLASLPQNAAPGAASPKAPLRVLIVGGGPVGLAFALLLRAYLGPDAVVQIWDRRWKRSGGRIVWCDHLDGNNRRRQVVTLQSAVWSMLPTFVQLQLFERKPWTNMWPIGPDSPASLGRPRNIRLRDFEDGLLDLAQDVYGIELVPEAYKPTGDWSDVDVLAICEGPRSATRRALEQFGEPTPYALNGAQLEDVVLGLEVRPDLPDEATVAITIAQSRFLLNSLDGGFLNMRLCREEAAEVMGIAEHGFVDCIQSRPCVMMRQGRDFVCPTHGTQFKPARDATSFLWPRITDGLKLYGVPPQNLLSITAFRLSMEHNPCFTARLAEGKFAFLLGDSANSLHFWPGRGLNTGLKSAVSLARCLASKWQGRSLRTADVTTHESLMHALQFREKGRAWEAMLIRDASGAPRPIDERIRAGLTGPFDRTQLVDVLLTRIADALQRLAPRMGPLPDLEWYRQRLFGLDDSTLKVLVETGPWVTQSVGGDEVSVSSFFPKLPEVFPPSVGT